MSKQWYVQQSTAEQLYEQTPDETVQLIWTDPPFGTDQLQVGSEHSYRDGTVADTLALIDHQQAAVEAAAGEIAPHAYDKELWRCTLADGRSMEQTASDAKDTAEAALTAAAPHLRAAWEVRAEKIRDLVSDKPENPYMYDPWDDSSIDPTNLDEVVGAAVSRGWGSGYYEGVQAVLALLEGGDNQ